MKELKKGKHDVLVARTSMRESAEFKELVEEYLGIYGKVLSRKDIEKGVERYLLLSSFGVYLRTRYPPDISKDLPDIEWDEKEITVARSHKVDPVAFQHKLQQLGRVHRKGK